MSHCPSPPLLTPSQRIPRQPQTHAEKVLVRRVGNGLGTTLPRSGDGERSRARGVSSSPVWWVAWWVGGCDDGGGGGSDDMANLQGRGGRLSGQGLSLRARQQLWACPSPCLQCPAQPLAPRDSCVWPSARGGCAACLTLSVPGSVHAPGPSCRSSAHQLGDRQPASGSGVRPTRRIPRAGSQPGARVASVPRNTEGHRCRCSRSRGRQPSPGGREAPV